MKMMFGNCKVEIDAEATRAYYSAHPELCAQDPAHRNYVRWIDTLMNGEADFFRTLGIDDHSQCALTECYLCDCGGLVHVTATYCVAGKVIATPTSYDTIEDILFRAGTGEVTLVLASAESLIADGLPTDRFADGQLFLGLIKEIPWVLDEPCALPTHTQFSMDCHEKWHTQMLDAYQALLSATGQAHVAMDQEASEQLKARCIERYVAPDKLGQARSVCYSGRNGRCFLWHMFSYEFCEAVEGDAAREQYGALHADDYYVYLEEDKICHHVAGGKLPDLEALEALPDTYVIAGSLDWIYAHTHEDGWCGPYLGRII